MTDPKDMTDAELADAFQNVSNISDKAAAHYGEAYSFSVWLEVDRRLRASEPAWRPIETAPKDGLAFIAWGPKGLCRCRWAAVNHGIHPLDLVTYWWQDFDNNIFFEDGPHDAPTHWMPFPRLPISTEPTDT